MKESVPNLSPEIYESCNEYKSKIGLNNMNNLLDEYGYEHLDESYYLYNTITNKEDNTPSTQPYLHICI